jgi:hypothetical protein
MEVDACEAALGNPHQPRAEPDPRPSVRRRDRVPAGPQSHLVAAPAARLHARDDGAGAAEPEHEPCGRLVAGLRLDAHRRGWPATTAGASGYAAQQSSAAIAPPLLTFEGLSNQDNFNTFGFRVNPPDPDGDVGPNHYVEIVNLLFAVYDKAGNRLLGPVDTGTLWAGFSVPDCTDPSGDPIVLYDQTTDRWILTQFTTRGLDDPSLPFYNCVAVSQTGDPTGAYFSYAFITQADTADGGFFFPDYPKYGVWRDSYVLTTRDFGTVDEYGISVYALEKNKMVNGEPNARAVQFFLDSNVVLINLIGDGLLPADIDGTTMPKNDAPIPIVGTQDAGGPYGAPVDALNIWELDVKWRSTPTASIAFKGSLPVSPFDSIFPCGVVPGSLPPNARDCLPQPGITDGSQFLDILSYRQRPTWRLAYRNTGSFDTMVTNQSVRPPPASPALAGTRSGAPAGRTRCTSRAHIPRLTACTAGWARQRWTRTATSPSVTAWSTAPTCSRASVTQPVLPATRLGRWAASARERSSPARACRRRRTRAGGTTPL